MRSAARAPGPGLGAPGRRGLVALAVVASLAAPGRADEDEPSAHAVTGATRDAASAWWTQALGSDAAPTVSREHPLEHLTVAKTRACRPLRAGRAIDARGAARVKACLTELRAVVGLDRTAAWSATSVDRAIAAFPHKQAKRMAALAAGARVVTATWAGAAATVQVWLVVGDDGRVRALWLTETVRA